MKIKCLLVMPGKEVQVVRIPSSTKFIKSFIGDDLLKVRLNENTILIINKNAQNGEFNRIWKGTIILGTFLVIAIKNNKKISLKKKELRKFTNVFKLRKHEKKILYYKNEYLEEYYSKQRELKWAKRTNLLDFAA